MKRDVSEMLTLLFYIQCKQIVTRATKKWFKRLMMTDCSFFGGKLFL